MNKEEIVAGIDERIRQDRSLLEVLESGKLRVGNGPSLRDDQTEARIDDMKRKIAEHEMLREFYSA